MSAPPTGSASRWPGQAVLAVPVPALDGVVRERTAHYDPAFVSSDPDFVHAHVTVLAPWLEAPSDADLARVASVAAAGEPFEVELGEVAVFPDGLVHLRPEPAEPFAALTAALVAAFPACVPYGGRHGAVPTPHLTLDHETTGVDVAQLRARWRGRPVRTRAERIDLQWWRAGECRRLATWPLGRPGTR